MSRKNSSPSLSTGKAPRKAPEPSAPPRRAGGEARGPVVERPVPQLAADLIGWLVTSLSVRLSRSASSYYQQHWNIGTTEYRLILALGIKHGCTAVRVAAAADVDKAAASRSLQVLRKDGMVELIKRGREMEVRLTPAGESLYQQLQAATLRREARITRGMSAAQVKRLHADLHRLIDNLPHISDDSDLSPPSKH